VPVVPGRPSRNSDRLLPASAPLALVGNRAPADRTDDDLAALNAALVQRRDAAKAGNAEFVDADIALHATMVAAAHNPVLIALFSEFVPVLRQGLIDLVELLNLRTDNPNHGDDGHTLLVEAIERADAEAAGRTLREELKQTLSRLQAI